jgi:hypothetical protein
MYTSCHVLSKCGNDDRARRATEILCWDLSVPWSITRPLKKRCEIIKRKNWSSIFTDPNSDGNIGTTSLEELPTVGKVLDP